MIKEHVIPLPHHSRLGSGNPESTPAGSHFLLTMGVRVNQLDSNTKCNWENEEKINN